MYSLKNPLLLRRTLCVLLLVSAHMLTAGLLAAQELPQETNSVQRILLRESPKALLANPFMGWETNNNVLRDFKGTADLPPSKTAYFKYYLKSFLREGGMIDLSTFIRDMERSKRSGQQMAFRLMVFSEEEGGEILREFGVTKGLSYRYDDGGHRGPELWAPDFDDEKTLEVLERLLLQIGRRFDGSPALSHVDIGYVGLWGEWHTSDTTPRVPMPSEATQKRIIDMHFKAFPTTPKLMQLQDAGMLRYAIEKGAGIRADCLAAPSTVMMKLYPLTLLAAGAQEQWKKAPFVFEICWTLPAWGKRGWDGKDIFKIATEQYHASAVNTKSSTIPRSIRPAFEEFLRKAGYRFTIREVLMPKAQSRNQPLTIQSRWENVGNAPCYNDFRLVVRLKSRRTSKVFPTGSQLCGRLPGSFDLPISLADLRSLPPDRYRISFGVAPKGNLTPTILLANTKGRNRWYTIGGLTLE